MGGLLLRGRDSLSLYVNTRRAGLALLFVTILCVNKDLGFIEHFHPSMHNPNWCEQMEAEFRASLTASGYVHEVEAEFGVQDTGVFDKVSLDRARTFYNYAYNELDYYQENEIKSGLKQQPEMLLYDIYNPAPFNRFRTMGIKENQYIVIYYI